MQAPSIEIKQLRKEFNGFVAVDNLSLNINQGEIFGFLGPNGAGKTTSINMICGLLKPTSGEISILGNKVIRKDFFKIKSRIGICPQNNIIWPKLTCVEQLEFMGEMLGQNRNVSRKRAIELLDKMGLSEKSNKLAQTLSGGMKRRLNICLAIIHDPEIIIFDEPEAGLDPQSRILVREFIKSISKNKTVILTTHNMDEAERMANRVAIIDNGKLLLINTPDELKKTIGPGDILEIKLISENKEDMDHAKNSLSDLVADIKSSESLLLLKKKNLIELIPEIAITLRKKGIQISEMKMRENSLEDVFIHLTGRSLRC